MRPMSSFAATNATTNQLYEFGPNTLTSEDCRFLLRSLEKQAFENIFYVFRAQGPLTQYKELLLEHIKTALFINDEDFTLHARIAANNPYLTKIAQELNPSYDNFSEWIAAGYDLTGVDLARAKKHSMDRHNTQFATNVNQILREIHRHNISIQQESKQLAELSQIPKRPFVPERLRRFLQETEVNADERIDTMPKKDAIIVNPNPSLPELKITTTIKKPVRHGVGRPRKNSTPKNPINPMLKSMLPIDGAMIPCCSSQLSSFHNKTIENNSTNKTRPPIPLDLSIAKSPEEQAVLAILAQSSAQISQQEAFEQQMREQMAARSSSSAAAATTATAMESLMEVALAQAQMDILPIQNPIKVSPKIPSTKLSMPILQQELNGEIKNCSTAVLSESKTKTSQPPISEKMPTTIQNNNKLIKNAIIDDITKQSNLTVGAILKSRRKRPAKLFDEKEDGCARVRPFVFERPLDGKTKLPRGNPDKKIYPPLKRPNSQQNCSEYAFGNNSFTNNNIAAISQQSYYQSHQFHSTTNSTKYYNNNNSSNDYLYNNEQRCLNATVSPMVISSSTGTGAAHIQPTTIVRSSTIVENHNHNIPTEIIVVNTMVENKCNNEPQNVGTLNNGISGQAPHIIDLSLPSTSYKIEATSVSSQNNVPVESGLDFLASLASNASLLAPIEMNNIQNQQQLQ